jgi:hypothetical protein
MCMYMCMRMMHRRRLQAASAENSVKEAAIQLGDTSCPIRDASARLYHTEYMPVVRPSATATQDKSCSSSRIEYRDAPFDGFQSTGDVVHDGWLKEREGDGFLCLCLVEDVFEL